ncbi:DUF2442 domain-containing protein [Rhizobium leguminosarum]|uniref:DUF2442 domain-containing protein n=1 Tax=Rhizobium leguminosarum TaxID=384 RepID=UPI0021BC0CF4|nr:DUF2442 domain-containing protein [Rhizobium leguminosarum]
MMREKESAKHGAASMEISDLEFETANMKGKRAQIGPVATSARFDADHDAIVVELDNGAFVGFPVEKLQNLQGASASQLNNIVVEAMGLGLHWPDIDADLYVPTLMEGIFGSRKWMAAQLGLTGGKAKSDTKATSSRLNGLKGGRPKKNATA